MTITATWKATATGAFNRAANWTPSGIPTVSVDVVVNTAPVVNVGTIGSSQTADVNSLLIGANGEIDVDGGDFIVANGDFSSKIQGLLLVAGGNLLMGAGTLTVNGHLNIQAGGEMQTLGVTPTTNATLTMDGTGDIQLLGGSIGGRVQGGGGLSQYDALISTQTTIHGVGFIGRNTTASLDRLLLTESGASTVVADVPGRSLVLDAVVLNQGLGLRATGGGMLDISGSVDQSPDQSGVSSSIIADAGSTVVLDSALIRGGNIIAHPGGTLDVANIVTLDGAAHPVFLSGTLPVDNIATLTLSGSIAPYVGSPATIDASNGTMFLTSATIDGMHIMGGVYNVYLGDSASTLIEGTTLDGGLTVGADQTLTFGSAQSPTTTIFNSGTVSLAGTYDYNLSVDQGATLAMANNVSLDAGGTIALGDAADVINGGSSAVLTLVNQVIVGQGLIAGFATLDLRAGSTIEAQNGTLEVQASQIANAGLLKADPGAVLVIDGTVDPAGGKIATTGLVLFGSASAAALATGTVAAGSTVQVGGGTLNGLENDGVLNVGLGGQLTLSSSPVNTGTIGVGGDGTLALLDSMQNSGLIVLQGTNDGTDHFAMLAGPAVSAFSFPLALTGGGTIQLGFDGVIGTGAISNADNTIEGTGRIGGEGAVFENSFSGGSYGTIDANAARGTMVLDGGMTGFIYNGSLMRASGGGTLEINSLVQNYVTLDFGDIERQGAGTIEADGANSVVLLNGGSIAEGLLDSANGGQIDVTGTSTLLLGSLVIPFGNEQPPYARNSALTNYADLRVLAGQTLTLAADTLAPYGPQNTVVLNNYGSVTLQGASGNGATLLVANLNVELLGGGVVTLSNAADRIAASVPGNWLINQNTIQGFGQLGAGSAQVENDSLVVATNPAVPLVLEAGGGFLNRGTLATGVAGGVMVLEGTIDNSGNLQSLGNGGTFVLGGLDHAGNPLAGDLVGAQIFTDVRLTTSPAGSTLDSGGDVMTNFGTIVALTGQTLTLSGAILNSEVFSTIDHMIHPAGMIEVQDGGTLRLGGSGALVETYGGQVLLDGPNATIDGVAGQTLSSDNNTISGSGHIGSGAIAFSNVDTYSVVNATGTLTLNTGSNAVNNAGTLQATGGGLLAIAGNVVNAQVVTSFIGSTVVIGGNVTGTGTLSTTGGTLEVDGTLGAGQTVAFSGFLGESLVLGMPGAMAGTITNFNFQETIDLKGVVATSETFSGGVLHVMNGANQVAGLAMTGSHVTAAFALLPDGNGGTDIVYRTPCYVAGSRILTTRGEVAVEDLRAGDVAVTVGPAPGLAEVRWVGHSEVEPGRHRDGASVAPVRVVAGAFAAGVPHRDLLLSPDHAVFVDGVLMQVQSLVNGVSIRREAAAGRVRYFHVELERHAILLAEGLPAESYLDTGNRAAFANAGVVQELHPDFSARIWDARACAALLLDGPAVDAAHARLARRAGDWSADPAVTLFADGVAVAATSGGPGWLTAEIPAGARWLRVVSRSAVPREIDRKQDARRLGVAVTHLVLDGEAVPLASARLGGGFHPVETDRGSAWRWTDGEAVVEVCGASRVELRFATQWLRYPRAVGAR